MTRLSTLTMFILPLGLQAQFAIQPSDTVSEVFPYNEYSFLNIDFPTAGSNPVTLKWTVIKNTIPPAWDRSMCDLPNCYFSIPSSATMMTYSGQQQGFLRLSLNAMNKPGSAELRIKVEDLNSSQVDTVTFLMTAVAPAPTGLDDDRPETVAAFVAGSDLIVKGEAGASYRLTVFDNGGRLIDDLDIHSHASVSVASWPQGIYLARLVNTDGTSVVIRFALF